MRVAAAILLTMLLLYAAACAALYAFQRSLLYFPQAASYGGPAETMTLAVDGAAVRVTVRAHAGPKALLYFGGNAEDVSASLPSFARAFPDYAIYLMHYRGYGGSTGKPSEAALHADARALFDKVHKDHPEVALIGRSLGSGVAVRLASERPATRLVLVTPYDSIAAIAAQQFPYFPVRWLLTDKFDSVRLAPAIRVSTLIVQAEQDEVIPAASTARLHAAFGEGVARRVIVPAAGHNTISDRADYLDAIAGLLR